MNPTPTAQRPSPILLGVNIDHSATVRQARYRNHPMDRGRIVEPDPVAVALAAEKAGADAITLHLREDRRHIQDSDVYLMRQMIQTSMNLEMAATDEMTAIALKVRPEIVLLVPEGRAEVTTEGGLDVLAHFDKVRRITDTLQSAGIHVSLFIDPEEVQIEAAHRCGASYVELHTGTFAHEFPTPNMSREFERLCKGATWAHRHGIAVNAGHGINYANVRIIRNLPHLRELNIGHSIISRALFTGIDTAVRDMKALMNA